MEQDDRLEDVLYISKEDLEGLINKGLIKLIGYDPNGHSVYANTELGNAVADELERTEGENNVRPKEETGTRH